MTTTPGRRSIAVTFDDVGVVVEDHLAAGFRLALVACHEDQPDFRIIYVLLRAADDSRVELVLHVPRDQPQIPSLARMDYSIGRFEREIRDLYGITPVGHPLPRRLVRHGHWPTGWYPMLRGASASPAFDDDIGPFPFLEVEGDGAYEIPVGPVHAGLIEPGHFRFSVVGETILRMKARLWFVHRGVERLFEGRRPEDGIAIAERISGDTAVGHSVAFAMAVEEAAGVEVSDEDRRVRALLLELERIHNHVADLGALANDVGYGLVQSHALRLRESLLRLNAASTGHRLLRDGVTVGGARLLSLPDPGTVGSLVAEATDLAALTLGNATVRDRFTGTSVLSTASASRLGVLGYVARASGIDADARRDHPFVDLGPGFAVVVEQDGDVLSRFRVRVRELEVSAAVVTSLVEGLAGSAGSGRRTQVEGRGAGLGLVEGWRGLITHRIELDGTGAVSRAKVVDPSFFNWPALPVALADTIVPDFPLTNKSFNQSYAGNDL